MSQPARRKVASTRPDSRAGPDRPPLEDLPLDRAREQPERHLGKFVITGELGRGGMGVVYKGVDLELNREVAIKLLWAGGRSGRRFATEAHTAARVRHPHVVRVHEVGEHDGCAYLVMDFVHGETLADRVAREGPLDPRLAAQVTCEVASALEAAHRHGVLHRDVKPSNVLLSEAGAQLTDFGLAKDLSAGASGLSADGGFLGTPGFAPPEQAAGALSQIGPRSDVYGLGATLYHALTGESPIAVTSLAETAIATCSHPPRPPSELRPGLDAHLERICLTCLAKEPDERPASAAALEAELSAWLGRPPSRRRWVELALASALLCALGGALAAWAWQPAPPPATTPSSPSPPQDPVALALSRAEHALASDDAAAALAGLPLEREVDALDPRLLTLAERAVRAAPQAPTLRERLESLPAGTTRDHLRCLAALESGELSALSAELGRARDRYRLQLSAALGLERQCRALEALMAPIEEGFTIQRNDRRQQLEQDGLQLFAEAQRLLLDQDPLPRVFVEVLRPRCDLVLAMLLGNYGEHFQGSPELYAAGQAHLTRCSEAGRAAFRVGLFQIGVESGAALSPVKDLPRNLDPSTLPPFLAFLHYRFTCADLTGEPAIELGERMLRHLQAHPELERRYTSSRFDQNLILMKLYLEQACADGPPDPRGRHLRRALELGRGTIAQTHIEELKTQHALTLVAAGAPADEIQELLRYVDRNQRLVRERALVLAELDLREGEPARALERLQALPEEAQNHISDTHALLAHAHALLGHTAACEAELETMRAAPRLPWIPWRRPRRAREVVAGKGWWPGAD